MYCNTNFPTKKALKAAVKAKAEWDKEWVKASAAQDDAALTRLATTSPCNVDLGVHQPGPFDGTANGRTAVEGPHYPQPHRWYADVTVQDGEIVKVNS